jgi:hypothetical protein
MSDTDKTLTERGNVHGAFPENSRVLDQLIAVMENTINWKLMGPLKRVALIYIAGKISRILSGDPNFADHWHDIGGYAKCVERELEPAPEPTTEQ